MLDGFIFWLATESGLQPQTAKDYSCVARMMSRDGAIGEDLNKKDFLNFCLQKERGGAQAETRRKYVRVVKKWCIFTKKKWGKSLIYPKVRRSRKPTPDFDTVMKFLEQDTSEMWNMFWLLHVNCGTRPGEVKNLRVEDIDLEQRCFCPKETKENDESAIIIFDWLIDDVRKYCYQIGSGFLFSSRFSDGKPVTHNAVKKDCRKRLAMIGCNTNYTPHSFRRAFATIAHFRGQMPLVMLQRLLRHSSIEVTEGYIAGDPDYVREAANMHPYNHRNCNPEVIVKELEGHIRKKLSDPERFSQDKVREISCLLYSTPISAIPPQNIISPRVEIDLTHHKDVFHLYEKYNVTVEDIQAKNEQLISEYKAYVGIKRFKEFHQKQQNEDYLMQQFIAKEKQIKKESKEIEAFAANLGGSHFIDKIRDYHQIGLGAQIIVDNFLKIVGLDSKTDEYCPNYNKVTWELEKN